MAEQISPGGPWIKPAPKNSYLEEAKAKIVAALDAQKAIGKVPPSWLAEGDDDLAKKTAFATVTLDTPPLDLSSATKGPRLHRVLLIGDSGTGKTHFIGTMPKPFVADFDNGLSTLEGKPVKGRKYSVTDGWGDFKDEVQRWRKGPMYGCETFALDSLSMASEAAMNYVLFKSRRSEPTIKEWGDAIREVKEVMGFLTTLPCHVAVTAHNQLVKDEILGDIQFLPLIFGKDLPHRLGIWFDEVYATTLATSLSGGKTVTEYRLQVKPDTRNRIIKSRMNTDGQLFEMYEAPDFTKLQAKITPPTPKE